MLTTVHPQLPSRDHEMELRVRYAEGDMQGRVFNGNYLTWVARRGPRPSPKYRW